MKTRFLPLAMVACLSVSGAWAANLTGTWKAEFETQIGVQKYTFQFQRDGERLTGWAHSTIGDVERDVRLQELRLEGSRLTFHEIFEFQGTEIRIDYAGQVDDDTLRLTRVVGEFATEQLVAKREVRSVGPAKTIASQIQGEWVYARGVKDGTELLREHFTGSRVLIDPENIRLTGQGGAFVFRYRLRASRQPTGIALEMTEGLAVGSTADGILAVDGDTLQLCYAPQGGGAPQTMEAPAGSGFHLFVLERVDAKGPSPASPLPDAKRDP